MAILTDSEGRQLGLHSRHLLGRSRRMHTVLDGPEVSAQHAVVGWNSRGWWVRDLGSRNGTSVRGERIEPGVDVPLRAGDAIVLGSTHAFVLASDAPPGPFGRCGELEVLGEGEFLSLPAPDDPQALISFEDDVGWVVVTDESARPIEEGATLLVDGRTWTLVLPESIDATVEVGADQPSLAQVGLDFGVSADEEYVELAVRLPGGPVALSPRAHHYPLLVLARALLEDADPDVPHAERGWVYASDLCRMLGMSANWVNLATYRARRELEALGVADAHELVQRRRTTQQVRLGVSDVTVSAL